MLGLEPGDVTGASIRFDLPKANEGVHLVHVAPHLLRHPLQALDQRIGAILHRLRLGAETEQQSVKQREPLRVEMADDRAGKLHERPRHRKGRSVTALDIGLITEKVGEASVHLPDHILGRHSRESKRPRGPPPAVEILFMLQPRDAHFRGG